MPRSRTSLRTGLPAAAALAVVGSLSLARAEPSDRGQTPTHVASAQTADSAATIPSADARGAASGAARGPLSTALRRIESALARGRDALLLGFAPPAPPPAPPVLRVVPVDAPTSSEFGVRRDPITRRRQQHHGLDFDARFGEAVHAAGAGRVVQARRDDGFGKCVIIDHGNGTQTLYAHLSRIEVRDGDELEPGDVVGKVGSTGRSTGPHLHFEVLVDGVSVDPRAQMSIPTREEWARGRSLRDDSLQM